MHLFILILWCFDGILEAKTEKALIFNTNTCQLDDMVYYGDFKRCPVLTACPSSLPHEIQFNEQISISKNSLFLRNVYHNDHYAKDIPVDICEKPIKPAVIYDEISKEIQIGYELYYEENKITLAGKNYDWYISTKFYKVNTTKNSTQQSKLFVTKFQDRYKNRTRFTFSSGSSIIDLIFHWIPVLSIRSVSDHQKCIPFLNVEVFKIKKPLSDKCSDYNATDEFVDFLYSEENQAKIWENVSTASPLPENTTANSKNLTENSCNNTVIIQSSTATPNKSTSQPHSKNPCGSPYGCLQQTQIIPLWYFRTNSAKFASCAYPNTVPIWKDIAEKQIAKVDRYIYALTRYVTGDLRGEARLYFGVYGVLKLYTSSSNQSQEIRLSDARLNITIPVPKIVYRIVHCAVCIWKKTLIVIHNDPTPIPYSERLCSENKEVDGWDEIKNTDYGTGFTYACLLTKEIDDMLGSQFLKSDVYRGFDGLDLKDFPYAWVDDQNNQNYDEINVIPSKRTNYRDIRRRVRSEFDSLIPIRRKF